MTLEVRNLQFAYKKNRVLLGVDLEAEAGQCVCLLGQNGAGKTTLFRCLLGLLDNYRGEIYLDGKISRRLTARQLAKKIAYIPQAHAPIFNYGVFETVLMGTNIHRDKLRSPGRDERNIAWEMLELMNITHLAERGYAEISGGERQLALIARALAQKSRVLVMDEPTANLDYGNQFRVMRQVKELAKKGYLVVLSTHNPEHALLYADKALVLKEGVAMMCGEPEKVLSPALIEKVYGVTADIQRISTPWGDTPVFIPYFE